MDQFASMKGPVIRGFGRGSKELDIPTANLDADLLEKELSVLKPGVYMGWASVGASDTKYKMVMSIGWYERISSRHCNSLLFVFVQSGSWSLIVFVLSCRNPFFKNTKKTVEPHLIHKFDEDFYGEELRLVVTAYMRPEMNFPSLDSLISAIRMDIAVAREVLDQPAHNIPVSFNSFLSPSC